MSVVSSQAKKPKLHKTLYLRSLLIIVCILLPFGMILYMGGMFNSKHAIVIQDREPYAKNS